MFNIKKEVKRVALYVRVSTEEQANNWTSVKSQKDIWIKYVKDRKDEYILDETKHIYIDAWYSWAKEDRPWLNKLLFDASNWEFDIVIVYKVDRFFRKTVFLLQHVEMLYDYWVWFKSITQQFDTSTSHWKFMLWMLWVVAELERDMIRERTVQGKLTRADEWFYVWWWTAKFWYDIYDINWRKKLRVNQEEAKIVREIFNLYWNEWKTLHEIANLMISRWIQTKYDKAFEWNSKNRKKKACHWYASNISSIVKDEMYLWTYYYWKTEVKRDHKTWKVIQVERKKDDPLLIKLSCPKIINDEKLFYDCQELLKRNMLNKNNKTTHPLTWFVMCWKCWRNYRWYKTTKKTLSYRCSWSETWKSPDDCRCTNPQISHNILIDEIWKKINLLINNTDWLLDNYYNKDNKKSNNIFLEYQSDLNNITLELDKLESWLMKLYEDKFLENDKKIIEIKDKVINDFKSKILTLESRREELVLKIDWLNKVENNKVTIKWMMTKIKKNLKNKLDDNKKIELIKILLDRVVVLENWDLKIILKFSNNENNNWDRLKKTLEINKENYINSSSSLVNNQDNEGVKKFNALGISTIYVTAKYTYVYLEFSFKKRR